MKHESRPVIHMEKNLGGAESLQGRSNSVSQVDGVSNMAPACRLCVSAEGGLRKGTVASAHLDARHFSHYATCAFQGATLVLELRGSESE